MWHPGFPFVEAAPAYLYGYHRAFCLYSEHYRGTPQRRGLVLGLDRGGSCRGRAFRVAATEAEAAMDYLIKREMFGHAVDVYALKWLRVALGSARDGGSAGLATGVASTSSPSSRGR
ncbi:MAG: gamma-glutamylcyclotransferase, partial [Proteobacteria bacterium]|nr:gamma-glutamylcyclotransferase [Pseudomonadota bacterium]